MQVRRPHTLGASALLAAAATALIATPAPSAFADVSAAYSSSTQYIFNIWHVPDLDQRRAGLENNGSNHCVPTSGMNWMIYFANHGVPSLPPGAGNYQNPSLYTHGTNAVRDLGILMGTTGTGGTGGTGGENGLKAWLPPFAFVVSHQWMNGTWAPRFQDMSNAVFNGAYVMSVVGWYQEFKFEPDVVLRAGGHSLSMNHGSRAGAAMQIGWRDPARDEGNVFERILVQSPFASEQYAIDPRARKPIMNGIERPYRTMDKVVGFGSAYLDEYYAIYPQFALASQPDPIQFDISKIWGNIIGGSSQSQFGSFDLIGPITDMTLHPDLLHTVYLGGTPPQLHVVNPISGDDTVVDGGFTNPSAVVVGRHRQVYVIDGDAIYCVNIDMDPPEVEAAVTPPHPPVSMMYDDATDQLMVLSPAARRLMAFERDLKPGPITPVPDTVPMEDDAKVAWDPLTGGCWVVSSASDSLFHLQMDPATGAMNVDTLSDPLLINPVCVQVGDGGRVCAIAGNAVHEFEPVEGLGWQRAATPLFEGAEVGNHFQLARSRNNYDPALHSDEEWYDLLPEEDLGDPIPDCLADLNLDGTVNVIDLLQLLTDWGPCAGPCYADLNADGSVDVLDLLQMLTDWGDCS